MGCKKLVFGKCKGVPVFLNEGVKLYEDVGT